jgi:curli biogenesis system outer membrane secretion channel CsgG
MRNIGLCLVLTLTVLLSACGKKEVATSPATASAPAAPSAPPGTAGGQPDFGGVNKLSREVEAVGSTQELAVLAALQMAVAQVNGVRVASQMQSVRTGLDVSNTGQNAGSVRSEAFSQKLIAASQGAIIGFEILSQEEIDKVDEEAIARVRASDGGFSYSASASSDSTIKMRSSADASVQDGAAKAQASRSFDGSATASEKASVDVKRGASSYGADSSYKKMRSYWKVRVKVDVAQYRAPDEQGRPKIIVALPRTLLAYYPVGDDKVSSGAVAQAVRGRLSDILTQTKRFIVLDREFGVEMQAEIDNINSANVRVQDSARLGQQLATDLILIPTIDRFEYPRRVQRLRMSDRELVSYSGSGRITLRLLNVTTGEVVMSNTFEHKLADADPSTMPRVVDGKNMATQMMDSLSSQIGGAIVAEIFPIAVVALNGDQVVLSQGGEALQVGQRWQAISLGEELKDPQTGRSLGRIEAPVGVVRIDRVSAQTSYGTFEDSAPKLSQPFKPGGIQLRQQAAVRAETTGTVQNAAPSSATKPAARAAKATDSADQTQPKDRPTKKEEDKSW